jgi:hypothetical protein
MKKTIPFILLILVFACKDAKEQNEKPSEKQTSEETTTQKKNAQETPEAYASFGKKINTEDTWSTEKFLKQIKNLKSEDTLNVKVKADVQAVCQKKGCWMKLALPQDENTMVRFKDYGFFVPKDIKGKEVVVSGKAYVNEMSVEDLRHYAKDGGKSKQEIEKITAPKKTYAFMADGVLVKQ